MKHLFSVAALAAAASLLPAIAQAQGVAATTAKNVNLRAGPARDYPIVAMLPPGYPITVEGCVAQYTWCDVIAGPSRGWVYAGNINYYYQGRWVPVPNYAPLIGIVVLSFILDDYWSHHYYDRPWYAERHRWINHAPPPQPRFRPPVTQPQPYVAPPSGPRPSPPAPLRTRPVERPAPGAPLPGVQPAPQPAAPATHAPPRAQQRQERQEQRAQQRQEQRQERKAEREQAHDKR